MDRHRGGDRSYGGGSNNGEGRRPSRFSDGPPSSRFSDGPPSSRFSDGPPSSRFSDGPPSSRFSDGPPSSRFSDGPPSSRFSDGPPSSRFSDGPPSSRFSDGPPSSRFSDGPPPPNRYSNNGSGGYGRRSPNNYRGGSGGGRRAFDSPPHHAPVGGGFRPMGGDDGFRPIGGGFGPNYPGPPLSMPPPPPLSGLKRSFVSRGSSPDRSDTGSFAKLFVGSVPRTATEEDIRPLFEEHGNVIEVALIKDKRTGQQQGCCFIKYATSEEADRAIKGLHNQRTLPGGVGPIQVRYADGERERLVEHKLFVGSLNKQATVKEVEEIFAPYGQVEDVYLMRDEMKQSRGCGFVKYSHRDMALAAINALNGTYRMRGCDQPLTVRFADPKRPRPGAGDFRGLPGPGPAFGGPGFGPRYQDPGPRPGPNFGDPVGDHIPSNAWNPMSPQNLGASAGPGPRGFGNLFPPRPGDLAMPFNQGGGSPADGVPPGSAISSAAQQGFNQPLPQVPPMNQQISPVQKPLQSPQQLPPLQLHGQVASSYSQTQPSHAGQSPFNQPLPSQPALGFSGQLSTSQPQFQQGIQSTTVPQASLNMNLQSHPGSSVTNQQPFSAPVQQQMVQPLQQSPSQLAQMLSQQTQTLQATFQSSQQAFSQLQQQLQMMQPPNQSSALQQNSQGVKQQWSAVPQAVANSPATMQPSDIPPSTSAPATAVTNQIIAPLKCNWTEHTSPEGFKYYYNSITRESRWDKPEELSLFEQQQLQQLPKQNAPVQQPQNPSIPQVRPIQQASQSQQVQLQTQFRGQQLQQPSLSSMESGYAQLPVAAGSVNDPARFQGLPAAQEWMWKNKPTGA